MHVKLATCLVPMAPDITWRVPRRRCGVGPVRRLAGRFLVRICRRHAGKRSLPRGYGNPYCRHAYRCFSRCIEAGDRIITNYRRRKPKNLAKLVKRGRNRTGPDVTGVGRPINFDGEFYSADGFRFSSSYYDKLWSNGRPAPFLQARSILDSNPRITPDPRGGPGYFRYESSGLEMIYNPTTGQVGHIQPIR